MQILLWEHWTANGPVWGLAHTLRYYRYTSERWYFDTTTRAMVGPVTTEPGQELHSSSSTALPPDYNFSGEFWHECVGTTRRGYLHTTGSTFTIRDILNATECGYTPPGACVLDIGFVSLSVSTATIIFTNPNPTADNRFSIDGGATWQTSYVFTGLDPGAYTVLVEDQDVPGCQRSISFTIEAPMPAAPDVPALVWSRNPVWVQLAASKPYRRLRMELKVETAHGSGAYATVYTAEQESDGAGVAQFRYERELHAQLGPDLPRPDMDEPERLTDRIRRFYVRYTELLDDGSVRGWVTLDTQTVLRGGLPELDAGEVDFFGDVLPERKLFLTWLPRVTRLALNQLAVLDLLLLDGALDGFSVRVKRYTLAGTSFGADVVTPVEFDAPGTLSLWRVPVRFTSFPHRITVQVEDGAGEPLSELRTFELVTGTPQARTYLLENSLGGFDPLLLTGRLSAEQTVERDVADLGRPADLLDVGPVGTLSTWRTVGREEYTVASGWLTLEEADWLRELLLARLSWEVVGGRLRALDVQTKKWRFYDEDGDLRALSFQYRYAFQTNAISAGLNATTTYNRPAEDAGSGGGDDS